MEMDDESFEAAGRFVVSSRPASVEPAILLQVLEYLDERLDLQAFESIGITFLSPSAMQELNRDYRAKDAPTDVLTFDVPGVPGMPSQGDIFLCVEAMEDQWELGTITSLTAFLCIHGVLHLTGMTHETEEKLASMIALQKSILQSSQDNGS